MVVGRHFFENGYGASVIDDGYGGEGGLLELAVIKGDEKSWDLCYETPITQDVIGWLSVEKVVYIMDKIKSLTPPSE